MSDTTIRISKASELLGHQRFYADTYLKDDDTGEVVLFIGDVGAVKGPSGRVTLRKNTDVITYASEAAMVEAVTTQDWLEDTSLSGDPRKWKPILGLGDLVEVSDG